MNTRLDAHAHDFDYMLGDWEFTVTNPYGSLTGRWSAVRLRHSGQIMDEFRILDDSGGTYFLSTTWRVYNALRDRWELVSIDSRALGVQNFGTAWREGDVMRVQQESGKGTDATW